MGSSTSSESFADVEAFLLKGVDLYLRGHTRGAAAAFHSALALDPTNAQAREYLKTILGTSQTANRPTAKQAAPTGWDDGPSLGEPITLEDDASESDFSVPHAEARLPEPEVAEDAREASRVLLKEARAAAALGDFTGAVERCDRLLRLDPVSVEGRQLREKSVETLVQMYESQLGGRHGIPQVVAGEGDIIWLGLDHRAGFVLAQIDGQVTYDDLYAICGMSPLDTSRILAQLLEQKVIATRKPSQAGR